MSFKCLVFLTVYIYIYAERTPSALQCKIKAKYRGLEPSVQKKLFGSQFWFFERIGLCLSENYFGNWKQGCYSSEKHYNNTI